MGGIFEDMFKAIGHAGIAASLVLITFLSLCGPAASQSTQNSSVAGLNSEAQVTSLAPIRTENPRRTVETFLALRREMIDALAAYRADRNFANFNALVTSTRRLGSLFDASDWPDALRGQALLEAVAAILDVFERIETPDPILAPDSSDPDTIYVLPETPFRIARVDAGSRLGEFLFASETVSAAPRVRDGLMSLPTHSQRPFESWTTEIASITGPAIPEMLENAFPSWGGKVILDTPLRKHVIVVVVLFLIGSAVFAVRLLSRGRNRRSALSVHVRRLITPAFVILLIILAGPFIALQVNTFGRFDFLIEGIANISLYLAAAWAVWLLSIIFSELIIRRPSVKEHSLDASLHRLIGRFVGVIAAVIVMAIGLQKLGVPVFSLLAGLGIGGLAVALAIRPSLENLIGGFILYLDQPARVGDFCQIGDMIGRIERIGVRSTQLRALDRTLITIPNAQFADMQIINWAKCDQMLLQQEIGLRYETSLDQLRWVLSKIRLMCHAHPKIDTNTVRVRFAGYGDFSLKIDIRVYVRAREWNEFFAVREDVMLRVGEIVAKSGSGFAFPSRTVYTATDSGLDEERGNRVEEQTARWRKTGQFPFPRFSAEDIERVNDRLAYPPYGSPDFASGVFSEDELLEATSEPLSAEPDTEYEEEADEEGRTEETPSETSAKTDPDKPR